MGTGIFSGDSHPKISPSPSEFNLFERLPIVAMSWAGSRRSVSILGGDRDGRKLVEFVEDVLEAQEIEPRAE
jgi:hypothetical protein